VKIGVPGVLAHNSLSFAEKKQMSKTKKEAQTQIGQQVNIAPDQLTP
jgi:hypothetical protein